MAISIDFGTFIVNIPQSFHTDLGGEKYEMDTELFRLALAALMDDEEGMPYKYPFQHNTVVTVSGVTLARVIEIINNYTLFFEETGTPYEVSLLGSNNNFKDFKIIGDGSVSIITNNTAGMTVPAATQDQILRLLGLVHEYQYIDNYLYDVNGNMTTARLRLFKTAQEVVDATQDAAGLEGAFEEYTILAQMVGVVVRGYKSVLGNALAP